ncbi:MAG: hypothetical protein HYY84_02575 [Deltaproteobacteria bacterium]|nr:hypothetical protein [Deltaproteobacteria bacterium]
MKSRVTTVVAPTVRAESRDVAYVWVTKRGAFRTSARLAEIPRFARAKVRVVPLRGDGPPAGTIYIADLRRANGRGEFPVTLGLEDDFGPRKKRRGSVSVMNFGERTKDGKSRVQGARLAEAGGSVSRDATAGGPRVKSVIMYATKWCGVCKRARKFLEARGVSVVERDLESEPGARSEMLAKAKKQGVATRGVPVFDVAGKIVPGFSEARIAKLIQ